MQILFGQFHVSYFDEKNRTNTHICIKCQKKEKISEKQAELKKLKAELKDFEAKIKEFELVQNDEELAKIKTRQEEISKELNIIVNIITESNKMLENLPDGTEMTLPFQIDMIRVYLILVKQQAQKK